MRTLLILRIFRVNTVVLILIAAWYGGPELRNRESFRIRRLGKMASKWHIKKLYNRIRAIDEVISELNAEKARINEELAIEGPNCIEAYNQRYQSKSIWRKRQ
jgi:hypothetical protein